MSSQKKLYHSFCFILGFPVSETLDGTTVFFFYSSQAGNAFHAATATHYVAILIPPLSRNPAAARLEQRKSREHSEIRWRGDICKREHIWSAALCV